MPFVVQHQEIVGNNAATFTFDNAIGACFYGIDSFYAAVAPSFCYEINCFGISLAATQPQKPDLSSVTITPTFTLTQGGDYSNCKVGVTVMAYVAGSPSGLTILPFSDIPSGQSMTSTTAISGGVPTVLASALSGFNLVFDGGNNSEVLGMGAGVGASLDLTQPQPAVCATGRATLLGDYSASANTNTVDCNALALTTGASSGSGVYVGFVDKPQDASQVTVNVGAPFGQVAIFIKSFFAQFQITDQYKVDMSPEFSNIGFGVSDVAIPGDGTFAFSAQGQLTGYYELGLGISWNLLNAPSIATSFVWVAVPGTAAAAPVQLIENPGFETGQLGPWTSGVSGNGTATVETNEVHQGKYAACLQVPQAFMGGSVGIAQTVTAPVSGAYQFVAYAAVDGGQAGLEVTTTRRGTVTSKAQWAVNGTGYAPYTGTIQASAGDQIEVQFGLTLTEFGPLPPAYAYLDDVALVSVPSGVSLVYNPGFATGSLFPWKESEPGLADVEAVDGACYAYLRPTAQVGVAIAQTVQAPLASNYRLSASAATNITGGVTLSVTVSGRLVAQQAVDSSDDKTLTLTFPAGGGSEIQVLYSAPAAAASGSWARLGNVTLGATP